MTMAYSTVPPPDVGAIASSTPVQIFGSQNRKSHLMNVTIVMRRALEKNCPRLLILIFLLKGVVEVCQCKTSVVLKLFVDLPKDVEWC